MKKLIMRGLMSTGAFLTLATRVAAQGYYDYDFDPEVFDYYGNSIGAATAATAGIGGVMIVVWCCVALVALVVPLVLAIVVYKDAQKHKVDNPILWALLSFFFSIIGLLIYFFAIRPDAIKAMEGTAPAPAPRAEEPVKEEVKSEE